MPACASPPPTPRPLWDPARVPLSLEPSFFGWPGFCMAHILGGSFGREGRLYEPLLGGSLSGPALTLGPGGASLCQDMQL